MPGVEGVGEPWEVGQMPADVLGGEAVVLHGVRTLRLRSGILYMLRLFMTADGHCGRKNVLLGTDAAFI